jgi:hypothetical protein
MKYEQNDNSAVRKTIIFPKHLWQKVEDFNKAFMFSSDVSAARFLISYGLRTNPVRLNKNYKEQNIRMYLNLSAALCNEISNFRFQNRLDAERDAILMLIEQGLDCLYRTLPVQPVVVQHT